MIKKVLAKYKAFLKLGTLKYGSTTYNKEAHCPYVKKEEKVVDITKAPTLMRLAT